MSRRSLADELKMTRPFRAPEIEAYLSVARTFDQLHTELDALFKQSGLTQQQYNVLRILRGAGEEGLPSLEIANRMVTRVPDITRLVDRMLKADLVVRRRCDKDRRVVWVQLTAKGRELVDRLQDPIETAHVEQMGHLDEGELESLTRLLEKVRNRPDR